MRPIVALAAALLAGCTAVGRSSADLPRRSSEPRRPVLVELFSSEGCSSCPPADAVLEELFRDQPVAGALVVPLELHVDYWNYLGHVDPFSQAAFTERQREDAARRGRTQVYTPQMIVDGGDEFVGSDRARAERAIVAAAERPKATVSVEQDGERVVVTASGVPEASRGSARVMLAITEAGLVSRVDRGENAGRTLRHGPVVRALRALGTVDGASFRSDSRVALDPAWNAAAVHLVAFVEDATTGRVLGAATR